MYDVKRRDIESPSQGPFTPIAARSGGDSRADTRVVWTALGVRTISYVVRLASSVKRRRVRPVGRRRRCSIILRRSST